MIRVLITDDSAVAREVLREIINNDPEMEVVGEAKNGREGVDMAMELKPDVITMDIHMPVMDGFEATKEIMIEMPTPIVIVSASTMVHEVEAGMKALRAGALTLLLKPAGPNSVDFDKECQEVVSIVKAMSDVKVVRHRRRPPGEAEQIAKPIVESIRDTGAPVAPGMNVVAIASSTGGPPALSTLLGGLPADFPVPILVVQHIADGFVEGFAKWLNSVVPPTVKLAENNEMTSPGIVYIAPQDQHLGVTRGGRIQLSRDEAISGFRPSGTYLFRSVAEAFRDKSVAMILTGMGRDGVDGIREIHRAGGMTIAQDEETCIVFGMPRVAIAEGLANAVLPIGEMAKHLLNLVACKA